MSKKLPHSQHGCKGEVDLRTNARVAYVCDISVMSKQRHFIKEWRKHRELTQEQLAERIGIDKSYLSKIENFKKRYDQPFLEAAAEILQCEPADLIIRNPSDPEGIWSIWEGLSAPQRLQVVEIAKTLKRTGTDN